MHVNKKIEIQTNLKRTGERTNGSEAVKLPNSVGPKIGIMKVKIASTIEETSLQFSLSHLK